MMVKRGLVLTGILIIGIVVLVYLMHYTNSNILPVSYYSDLAENVPDQGVSVIELSDSQVVSGEVFDIGLGDSVKFDLNDYGYSFRVINVDSAEKRVYIGNGELLFYISENPSKLDLNRDDIYDILVYSEDISDKEASVSFKMISEEMETSELIDSGIESVVRKMEESYNLRFDIFLILLAVFLILLGAYIVFAYVLPLIHFKKITGRHRPDDALEYLISEFARLKKKNDRVGAVKIYHKAKHLYNYLSKNEKTFFKARMREMERYIN